MQEIHVELEHRKQREKQTIHPTTTSDVSSLMDDQLQRDQSPLHSALTNLAIIVGFAAFAYTVKYVLRSIAME